MDVTPIDVNTPLIAAPPPLTGISVKWWKPTYVLDYLVALLLFGVLAANYFFVVPVRRYFFMDDESFMYPFVPTDEEIITTYVSILLSYVPPVAVIVLAQVWFRSLHDVHHALLSLLEASAINGVFTACSWNWIGQPRPDFFATCNPIANGECASPESFLLQQQRRSFPSGHASFAFTALGLLSLYLYSKFQPFRRASPFYSLVISISPLFLAYYITATRLADYRHSPIDMLAGTILGLFCALLGFRMNYPPISSPNSGVPLLRTWTLWQSISFKNKAILSVGAVEPLETNLV